MSDKPPKITDFAAKLAELATTVVDQAQKLPKAQFDMRLDAFKAATAYQSVMNRAPDTDEGGAIADFRQQLLTPAPTPSDTPEEPEQDEDQDDGGPEDTGGDGDPEPGGGPSPPAGTPG